MKLRYQLALRLLRPLLLDQLEHVLRQQTDAQCRGTALERYWTGRATSLHRLVDGDRPAAPPSRPIGPRASHGPHEVAP